jgi:hypothetical protein
MATEMPNTTAVGNDVLLEMIALVSSADRLNKDDIDDGFTDGTQSELYKDNDKCRIHLIIYAFLALSLVQNNSRDVCAVVVYQHQDGLDVHVAKNGRLEERFKEHVERVIDLVKSTAKTQLPNKRKFVNQYFECIRQFALPKLIAREKSLRHLMTSHYKDHSTEFNIAPLSLLKDAITAYSQVPLLCVTWGDRKVASLSSIGDVYDGLKIAISKIEPLLSPITNVDHINLAYLCSAVSETSLVRRLNDRRELYDLIEAMKKVGQYYRGTRFLYERIVDDKYRARFCNIAVEYVEYEIKEKRRPQISWYDLLKKIYKETTGNDLPLNANRFQGIYGGIIHYGKSQEYVGHCETKLISELIRKGRPATEIGVSKACCGLCYHWVKGVNAYLMTSRGNMGRWLVGGNHHKVYYWEAPQDTSAAAAAGKFAVRDYLKGRIMHMIYRCLWTAAGESPSEADGLPDPPDSPFMEFGD